MIRVVALVAGPVEHGVVRHGLALAAAAGLPVVRAPDELRAGAGDVVVAEFADRLLGRDAEAGAAAWTQLAGAVHAAGARLVASLHDVPAGGDSPLAARRLALFRTVVAGSDAVFTASGVDAARLTALGLAPARLAVLPLPVPPALARPAAPLAPIASVTVLGFLWPGKGHAEVAAAMSAHPATRELPLVCAGRPSDGHEDLVAELRARHPNVVVTGFVPDTDLPRLLQAATVPVAPNRSVGSSASVSTWWQHGRRPLVPDAPLTRELAAHDPAAVHRYGDTADLTHALVAAVQGDPVTGWLPPGCTPGAGTAETARRRTEILAGWFG